MYVAHTHDRGHVQGHEVTDVEGHAVEVVADHDGDIDAVATHDIEVVVAVVTGVAAAVSHRNTAAAVHNTTTTTHTPMNDQKVAANQWTTLPARLETTNHHWEIAMALLTGAVAQRIGIEATMMMNSREIIRLRTVGVAAHRLSSH